jgi:transposase
VRREALYLRSQGVANAEILRLCGISKASFHRYLRAYMAGGITQLKHIEPYRPHSELTNYRTTLEAYFHQHPPATVAEAAAKIAELTGIVRQPTQVRQYLRALGMKPMKVGMLPAKADVEAQEAFKKKAWSPGYRPLGLASAPSVSLMRPTLCSRPFSVWSGVSNGGLSKRPLGGNG